MNDLNWKVVEVRAWWTALFFLACWATWVASTWFFGWGW